jgi:dihydrofolate reductase
VAPSPERSCADEFRRHRASFQQQAAIHPRPKDTTVRTLIVTEFVTLDGVMEAPGGEPTHPHGGWVGDYFSDEVGAYKQAELFEAEIHLLGRKTYESFAGAWPDYEGDMAVRMNSMPKIVVSNTLSDPGWTNTTVLSGDAVAGVRALKENGDGPLLIAGSATLVHAMLDNDLVDELRLMVFPVTIGEGLRVFSGTIKKSPWVIADTQSFPSGVRVDAYRPA